MREGDPPADAVVLPPVEVMRPRATASAAVPTEDGMPGGTRYEIKLDGVRAVAYARGPGRTILQSRNGRDLARDFPQIAAAVAELPSGAVFDGELVATVGGRFSFEGLLRTRAAREASGVAVSYVAFDLLAHPDLGDVRPRPLSVRVALLGQVLAGAVPPLEPVMATTNRAEALAWQDALAPIGVEGLVCKGLRTSYRPGSAAAQWIKVRRTDTVDARLVAVVGTARRPRSLLIELPDGKRAFTSSQLDTRQARQVADAVAGRLAAPVRHHGFGQVIPLADPVGDPIAVEVAVGTGRHRTVRFVRVKLPWT